MFQLKLFGELPSRAANAALASMTLIALAAGTATGAPVKPAAGKAAVKPASAKTAVKPADKAAARPAVKTTVKPVDKAAVKPAAKPAPRPAPVVKRPAVAVSSAYVIYARPPFSPIRLETKPAAFEALKYPQLSIFACADEVEPVTFAVYANRDLRDVTVRLGSEFLSESGAYRLPADAFNIHVVKPLVTAASPTSVVPELLLKDDRVPLVGPEPDVRLTGDPQTDIATGTSKQFWVTVSVPVKQLPSTYTGTLLLSAQGIGSLPIALKVEILPMKLRTAFLQYGMDFRSMLSQDATQPGQPVVTPEVFARQLENIRSHGFRFVSLYDPVSTLPDAFRIYKEAGMSKIGPIIIMSPLSKKSDVERIEKLRAETSLSPDFGIYYGVPTPPVETALEPVRERFTMAHEATRKAMTMAPILERSALDVLGKDLNVPVFSVYSDYAQQLLVTGKREIGGYERDWWGWSIGQETPIKNRLYAGFLLYRTGAATGSPLYGAFAGPYQFAPDGDPYTGSVASAESVTLPRPQMATYPARGGVIDTLQWEAAREGIDDIRYIGNMMGYKREVMDLKIRKDVTDATDAYFRALISQPLATLSPGQLQEMRRGIASEALKLITILRAKSPSYPE